MKTGKSTDQFSDFNRFTLLNDEGEKDEPKKREEENDKTAVKHNERPRKLKVERVGTINANNLHVKVILENREYNGIVDTGCNLTLINSKVAPNYPTLEESKTQLKCANDSKLRVLGKSKSVLTILNRPYQADVHIVEGLNTDIVIGTNFLLTHAAVLDFNEKYIKLGKGSHSITIPMDENWIKQIGLRDQTLNLINNDFLIEGDLILLPHEEKIIPLDTELVGENAIYPNDEFIRKSGIMIKQTIVDNKPALRLWNYTHIPQKVFKNQRIAYISEKIKPFPIQIEHVNMISSDDKPIDPDNVTDYDGNKLDISPKLTDDQRRKAVCLLRKFRHLFTMNEEQLGKANVEAYELKVKDNEPVVLRPYKLSPVERREMRRQLEAKLKAKILERSRSNYSSPAFLMKQKDKYRFLCNFIQLNKKLIPDRNSVPRIENIIQAIQGNKFFTLLDANSGFHQIPIAEWCRYLTAINVENQLYQFTVLPQGLTNSPAAFTKVINTAFADYLYEILVAYMDDMCTYGITFEQALENLEKILKRLEELNLKLKTTKCKFFYDQIEMLGHQVNGETIQPLKKNTEAIENFTRPTTVRHVQSFIGMVGHYRKFIKNFAKISACLSDLTKGDVNKNTKVDWTDEHENAFQFLKTALITEPILAIYKEGRETIVETDASKIAVGGVLSQVNEITRKTHPVGYFSRKLQAAQKNYCAYDLELTALVDTITHFREYLHGIQFTVYTDHAPLKAYTKMKEPNSRMARMILKLSEYTFDIIHKPGKTNIVPDVLSRTEINYKIDDTYESIKKLFTKLDNEKKIFEIKNGMDMREEQEKDDFCGSIIKVKLNKLEKTHPNFKQIVRASRRYIITDNLLKLKNRKNLLIVVPRHLVNDVLQYYHDKAIGGGHLGTDKTLSKIQTKYYWTGIVQDVRDYIRSCHSCQMRKGIQGKKPGLLQPIEVPVCEILSHLELDFVGPLPPSKGHTFILVGTCKSTRFAVAKPLSSASSASVATFIYELVSQFGVPKVITTDNGTHFRNDDIQAVCDLLGCKKGTSTTYSPQSQGQVERLNGTLTKILSHYVNKNRTNWSDFVKFVVFAYNVTPLVRFQGLSPYYILYGQQPNLPLENKLGINTKARKDRLEEIAELHKIREMVPALIKENQDEDKRQYDKKHKEYELGIGDMVLVEVPQKHKGKFAEKYHGPYKVIRRFSPLNYEIQMDDKVENVHVRRLKKYHTRE